ncbi:MAG TPA: hypothetical protein VJ376_16760 [Pseudomonadota bacterium]|nr:hypothetical protein [Pseudomonadota bacterium]
MKKLLLAGVSFAALIAGPAMAADLGAPVYRAPAVVVPVASWSEFYVGINTSGSIGVDAATQSAVLASPALGANGLLASCNRFSPTGWILGGKLIS